MRALTLIVLLLAGCGIARGEVSDPNVTPGHVLRITALIESDGKPVRFDELVGCGVPVRGVPRIHPLKRVGNTRSTLAQEVPGGGMLIADISREVCFQRGWRDQPMPDAVVPTPEGWTPVLQWFDHRDPERAETGLLYYTETALEDPKGRLRIREPFRITVPEHPPSEALVREAVAQAVTRDVWLNRPQERVPSGHFQPGRMLWMVKIPAADWRDGARARVSMSVGRHRKQAEPDCGALARDLADYRGTGFVNLGIGKDVFSEEGQRLFQILREGRTPSLHTTFEYGIPRTGAERHGMMLSPRRVASNARNPFFPNRHDNYIPLTCVNGVITTVPEHPGLRYWFREPCFRQEHRRGAVFFGQDMSDTPPDRGSLILNLDNGDLWWTIQ